MSDKPIINQRDLEYITQKHGDKFEAKMAAIANFIGAKKLGYRMTVVSPGKKAWPYHAHLVNEKKSSFMIFGKQDSGVDYWEDE